MDFFRHNEVPEEFLELARRIPEPVICDVGSRDAIDGLFLLEELKGRELHVFEPNPPSVERCREHIDQYPGKERVHLNPVACSSAPGTVDFYPVDPDASEEKDTGLSSMFKVNPRYMKRHGKYVQKQIQVEAITLDSYFEGRTGPDVMWLDVEGAELLVLEGAPKTLESVKLIHVEVGFRPMHEGKPLFWEIDAHLRGQGFTLHGFVGIHWLRGWLTMKGLWPNPPWRWNAIYARQ